MSDKDAKLSQDTTTPPPIDYQKDIHNVSLEDIFNEEAEEEDKKLLGETTPEETKTEAPAEPTVSTAEAAEAKKEEPAPPAIDQDKLKEEISDATAKKLLEQLAPADATKEEKKEWRDQLKDLEAKAKAEGRDFTYEDALAFLHDVTKEQVKTELKDEVKQEVLKDLAKEVEDEEKNEAEKVAAAEKAKTERYQQLAKQWDNEMLELEEAKLLPKPLTTDPNDPARKERVAFLTAMQTFNQKRVEEGKPEVLNMVQFHALHYTSPNKQSSGANAPVAGARRSVSTPTNGDFDYSEIHTKSLDSIMRGE